tara:strand:- start:79 stop:864 length:786 start_codon:yes stop_codon:yes gene_type:complete
MKLSPVEQFYIDIERLREEERLAELEAQRLNKKKRGRPRKKKMYFTPETDLAIIAYNAETNQRLRNKVYNEFIRYPFDKLAENIIHTFKFYYMDGGTREVKHEVIAFLLEKLGKFNTGKGKAFSYFSIVAKNYLIQNNNRHYKDLKNKAPLTVLDTRRDIPGEVTAQERLEGLEVFIDRFAEYYDKRIDSKFRNDRDKKIAGALLVLFRDRKNIEIFNKKALYIMIREMTNTKTQHITKVVNVIREDFAALYKKFNEGRFF